ncbi:hypothetical protein [Actinoplanes sp. NPDC049265]|uniref:hypothetical protein n=1 Tax=Actinoplanes sp. NPDC049265 TaxID=3363902 RepID=UPI0037112662
MKATARRVLFAVLLLAAGAVALSPVAMGWEGASFVAAVVGGVVAIAWTATELADRLRRAERSLPTTAELVDQLAEVVEGEWRQEARSRRLRDPQVLPLIWSTRAEYSDAPAAVFGRGGGQVTKLKLDGRLDEDFEAAITGLAEGFARLPSRRLVVLGEPGAGKTALSLLLTLGLLRRRTPEAPVPVLLSASSWDPVMQPLDDWVVQALAASYYGGRTATPARLLAADLLLPILDGLDEIPESARRSAVGAINYATRQGRPVVVTCRSAEYQDVIRDGAPVLHRAPVVEIEPVPVEDAITYLSATDWPAETGWDRVYQHLRQADGNAASPVAVALSSPLMISLAALVYRRNGGDPGELLDPDRFDTRHKVEDHLTDQVIEAAYAPERGPGGEVVTAGEPRWSAADARTWLTFLARDLHRHRERDVAWWLVSQRLLSPWVVPGISLGVGLLLLAAVALWVTVFGGSPGAVAADESNRLFWILIVGGGVAAGFAVISMIIWYAGNGRPPGQLTIAWRGSLSRLRRGFLAGLAVVTLPGGAVLVVAAAVITISQQWTIQNIDGFTRGIVGVAFGAVSLGLALAGHAWLDAPPERAAQSDPLGSIRQDRRSSLAGAGAAAIIVAASAFALTVAGLAAGSLAVQSLTGWSGWPGERNLGQTVSAQWHAAATTISPAPTVVVGAVVLLPAVFVSLLVLLTRAWPRFVLARVVLAGRGLLPLRLPAFLDDARDRGVLRLAGGVYQFRHVRLQERLVAGARHQPQARPGDKVGVRPRPRSMRRPAVAGAVLVLLVAAGAVFLPKDTAFRTFAATYGSGHEVTFSPDGSMLAISGYVDGLQIRRIVGDDRWIDLPAKLPSGLLGVFPSTVEFSRDGQALAAVGYDRRSADTRDGPVLLWRRSGYRFDLVPISTRRSSRGSYLLRSRFLSDGTLLSVNWSDFESELWDIRSAVSARRVDTPDGFSEGNFNAEGTHVVMPGPDGRQRLLEAAALIGPDPSPTAILPAAVEDADDVRFGPDEPSPGGAGGVRPRWIVTVDKVGSVALLDGRGKMLHKLGSVGESGDFSNRFTADADGGRLALLDEHRKASVWDLRDLNRPRQLSVPAGASTVLFDSTGRVLAIGGKRSIVLHNLAAGPSAMRSISLPAELSDLDLSPGGKLVSASMAFDSERKTTTWIVGEPMRPWPGPPLYTADDRQAFTRNGCLFVQGQAEGSLQVWNLESLSPIELAGHGGAVTDVELSPTDDRLVATSSLDGTVRLWRLPFTGNCLGPR